MGPAHCGEIDIRIAGDGTWFHQGPAIGRRELVRLFSTILRKEADCFYLVTPAEKLRIKMDDAPFMAVLLDVQGSGSNQQLDFTGNVGEVMTAGSEHPVRVEFPRETEEPSPYIHVRFGLEARLSHNVFYQLAEIALLGQDVCADRLGVWRDGQSLPLGSSI